VSYGFNLGEACVKFNSERNDLGYCWSRFVKQQPVKARALGPEPEKFRWLRPKPHRLRSTQIGSARRGVKGGDVTYNLSSLH